MIELLVQVIVTIGSVLVANGIVYKITAHQAKKELKKFQMSEAGRASGEVRAEKGLYTRIANDLLDKQNPVINMVLEQFPSVKDYVLEHPSAIPALLKIVSPYLESFMGGNNLKPQEFVRPYKPMEMKF